MLILDFRFFHAVTTCKAPRKENEFILMIVFAFQQKNHKKSITEYNHTLLS